MNDDFEKRLQRVAPREIPSAWREEILTTAQQAQAIRPPAPGARPGFLATLIHQLSTLIRPQRAAWSSLAAVWLVILALNIATRDSDSAATQTASLPTPETLQALKTQKSLLAELIDRPAVHVADRSKTIPPGPRSQCREDWATA